MSVIYPDDLFRVKEMWSRITLKTGWFELDFATFLVRRGRLAPPEEYARIDDTLDILNLRQCIAQRGDFITDYRAGHIDLRNVERYAPFIASELRRQGQLVRGDA